jgi:hypothetical protein
MANTLAMAREEGHLATHPATTDPARGRAAS